MEFTFYTDASPIVYYVWFLDVLKVSLPRPTVIQPRFIFENIWKYKNKPPSDITIPIYANVSNDLIILSKFNFAI